MVDLEAIDGSIDDSVGQILLTVSQASRALSIGRTALYDLLRSGVLASVQIRGSRRIRTSDLRAFAEQLPATFTSSNDEICTTVVHKRRQEETGSR